MAVSAEQGQLSRLWPPVRFEPRTHRLRGWIIDFPSLWEVKVNGLTTGQVIRLIGLLLVFANQKIFHNVRNEMAESIVPLRKIIKVPVGRNRDT